MITVELTPDVMTGLRAHRDHGTVPERCHAGVIRSAVASTVAALQSGELSGKVRPWHLAALQRHCASSDPGAITGAQAVRVDDVLVAELLPTGERLVFRGVDDGWRLVRFAAPDEETSSIAVHPETSREVSLTGSGPDAVLAALDLTKPDDVEMSWTSEDLGQGETESRSGYYWTDGAREFLAEEVKNEIFDGATPSTRYVRGVIIDGDRGVLLHGRGESATVIQG